MVHKNKSFKSLKRNQTLTAYLFLTPAFLGFMVFIVIPVVFLLCISFSDWNLFSGFSGIKFTGLENYKKLFDDYYFLSALKNNFIVTIVSVPTLIILSLLLASIANKSVYMSNIIRSMMFMPYIATLSAIAVVFVSLYNGEYGPINTFLRSIGISNPPNWLADPFWALPAVMVVWIWQHIGYNMVIYMAALKGISNSYYEAAKIDGATAFQQFRYITLPLVSPTTFFLAVVGIINSFRLFPHVQIMTEGGPGSSTMVLIYYIYKRGFEFYEMGYAATLTWVFFIIVFVITLIQWIGQKKWVQYV